MKVRVFIFTLIMLSLARVDSNIHAQERYHKIDTMNNFVLYFRIDGATLDSAYMGNSESLKKLDDIIKNKLSIPNLDSITIKAASSPDGRESYNLRLSEKRAAYIKTFIMEKYPMIKSELIRTRHTAENWEDFTRMIEDDKNIPHREKVLKIIRSDREPDAKEWLIKILEKGETWRYIKKHFLPVLRTGAVCVIYYKQEFIPEEPKEELQVEEVVTPPAEPEPEPVAPPVIITKPLFAIKTNLLYDVLSAANLEIEVPIGKQWSVAAEGIFPWWKASRADWTMQLLAGHATVKYWFGDRDAQEVLTGWNIGLYGGVGKYDLQFFDKDGEQGDFFDAGIQGAYAHKIGKCFRMEYSLGVGYLQRDSKKYDKANNTMHGDIKVFRYPWEVKRRQWFGPTSAKISLVWLLNKKTVKKEGGVK
ncbi:DUF3575 domain-containing protein [uncultured Butyricimonas sp.]|uniref:DUF3575 domain-containing protein n=1 Tax=uncultured Butyricimonas sp. TaxID=1268785 RepID=UPI0026DC2DE3|nr:DUF3575 domain-containing protein [uncultured Butyricimonas sp.]